MTPLETQKLVANMLEVLGDTNLEDGLTVLTGTTGHLVAAMAGGAPGRARAMSNDLAEAIYQASLGKIVHDDKKS